MSFHVHPMLRLSLRPWKLAPVSQFMGVITVGFLLFLGGFLFWLQSSLNPIIKRMQNSQIITAYLNQDVSGRGETEVMDAIRLNLGSAAERQKGKVPPPELKLVDTHDFLGQLSMSYPELRNQLVDMGTELNYLVPRHITISGELGQDDLQKVQNVAGIESAESSSHRFKSVVGAFQTLQWVSQILTFGLAVALLSGLIHLARMNAWLNVDLISWMRLLGADLVHLRLPPAINGLLIGLAGGACAYLAWILLSVKLAQQVSRFSPVPEALPLPVSHLAVTLLIWGAVTGLISGLVGGVVSDQRARSQA